MSTEYRVRQPLVYRNAVLHRLILAGLPRLSAAPGPRPPIATKPWPMSLAELAALILPGIVLAIGLGAWTGKVSAGLALAMFVAMHVWRNAAVRYGHQLIFHVNDHLRSFRRCYRPKDVDAIAAAVTRLLAAVVGFFPLTFGLQALTLALGAIGTVPAMLLATIPLTLSLLAFSQTIIGLVRGYRDANRLTDGLLETF
ncbi:hypothetical protein [Luteimonas sp. e5]